LILVGAIALAPVGAKSLALVGTQLMEHEPGPRGSPHAPHAPIDCDVVPFALPVV
jgi:hypothetical protein